MQPVGIVSRELPHPVGLANLVVQVKMVCRQPFGLLDPRAHLDLHLLSVYMDVNPAVGQRSDQGRVGADRSARDDGRNES